LIDALQDIESLYGNQFSLELEREAQVPVAGVGMERWTRNGYECTCRDAALMLLKARDWLWCEAAAEPAEMRLADRCGRLVRDLQMAGRLRHILSAAGLPCDLSDGWGLGSSSEGAAEADLTPFERLVSEAGIHVGETPPRRRNGSGTPAGRNPDSLKQGFVPLLPRGAVFSSFAMSCPQRAAKAQR
jgi:hypothetical protein